VRLVLAVALLLCQAAGSAAAEERPAADVVLETLGGLAEQLRLRLDVLEVLPYGASLRFAEDEHFALGFNVDLAARRARLCLGGGDRRALAFRLETNVVLDQGAPRIQGRLDLAVAGHSLTFRLPAVRVIPRFQSGNLVMEYHVPLIEGRF
jgi:hypothetical protein